MFLHASAVQIHQAGLLITGASGSGKSSLCAELIARGGALIADDQTVLSHEHGQLYASAPASLSGLIELHAIGVIECANLVRGPAVLAFEVHLSDSPLLERLPEPQFSNYLGVGLPCVNLQANQPFNAAKLQLLAQSFQQSGHLALVDVAKRDASG